MKACNFPMTAMADDQNIYESALAVSKLNDKAHSCQSSGNIEDTYLDYRRVNYPPQTPLPPTPESLPQEIVTARNIPLHHDPSTSGKVIASRYHLLIIAAAIAVICAGIELQS